MGDIHFKRIQEQSELEMKQKLSDNQISLLLKNESLESYCAKIEKVMMGSNNLFSLKCTYVFQYGYGWLKFDMLVSRNLKYPCIASENRTPADGNCLIHGKNFYLEIVINRFFC